jgi:hypothetical protein
VGLLSATAFSSDEQEAIPIVPVRAIALIKAKYLIFFILRNFYSLLKILIVILCTFPFFNRAGLAALAQRLEALYAYWIFHF